MTKKTFNSMMNFFKNSKGILIADERVLSYWEVLRDYPDKYAERVTFGCEKKYDFFPAISQIVKEFEFCADEDFEVGKYVKKIEGPKHVKRDLQWIRQTLILLSCKGDQCKYHLKLYTNEELEQIVEKNGGDKRLLKTLVDGFEVNVTTGEVDKKQKGEIICQDQR